MQHTQHVNSLTVQRVSSPSCRTMRRIKAQVSPGRSHVIGMLCLLVHGARASCIAGKEPGPSSGSCAKCSPGTFKAAAGTEACASCPINSYSASGRAEDLATATASISPATTSVGGDEISVSELAAGGSGWCLCSRCWAAGCCPIANVGHPVHVDPAEEPHQARICVRGEWIADE